MPTFTSVRSGYWNDPTVWDQNAVPSNGDSVVIAAGHTVTFNVDQSAFTTGLAGLTINGTLKIPSQAEDPSMPGIVVLKVNANIAGSGSFIIGSPTQPITYPQSAKIMVNGTITVATFNAYGEQRSPLWDYLAQDAPSGATTIVLQNGLPLRAGDLIAIGRSDFVGSWSESNTTRGLHTVASYNAATKTVTLNEALTQARAGTGVSACLVILLSRQIVISKYGSNNATLISGSGRTIQGVLFQSESGATVHSATSGLSSSSLTSFATIGFAGGNGVLHNASNLTINDYTAYASGGYLIIRMNGSNQATNVAVINANFGFSISDATGINWSITSGHFQNCPVYMFYSANNTVLTLNQITCKNADVFSAYNPTGTFGINWDTGLVVDGSIISTSAVAGGINMELKGVIKNIQWQAFRGTSYTLFGAVYGNLVVQNLNATHNVSGFRVTLADTRLCGVHFVGCSLSAGSCALGNARVNSCRYISCSLSNAFNPIIANHYGISEIVNLNTNAYYRPTFEIPLTRDALWTNRILVKGLTVGATSHPKAFEHLFPHGYVKNKWDAATPDYTTFDFILTQSSFVGQPLWLEYQVFTADPIRVTGTITQLNTGESIKVQIFSAGKESLYGDTPDFEQSYTATGDISVNWTPTDKRTWIVRVLAYLQQTTNPITIQNLQVAGGGTGGGQTYNINVTDGITPSLSDAANIAASLMVTDSLNPTLTDQASLSAQIALSDAINPTLQDQSQAQVQVTLVDDINPTLQDIVDVQSGTFYNISVSDQITPSLADSVDEQIAVSVSESISPQLQDQASPSIQISASEMISPTIQEQVYEQAQISVNETIMPTLQDLPTTQVDVSASETIAPTLQEQVNVTAGGSYHIVEPLDIDITEDELEV
jgi:hypothetical protein